MEHLIGGRYEKLEEIARSGGGVTHRARDAELDAPVALTLVARRFDGEVPLLAAQSTFRAARELHHEAIIPVLDLVHEGDLLYVVEALPDGEPLDLVLGRHGPFSSATALEVARQLASGLVCAHERGVIHGGVRSARVVVEEVRPWRVCLGGFGLAALERPELGEGDPRIDVFALGALVLELCSGDPGVFDRLVAQPEPLPLGLARGLPSKDLALVARATRLDPADRFPTMAAMLRQIEMSLARVRTIGAGVTDTVPLGAGATEVQLVEPRRPQRRLSPVLLAGGAVAAAAALGLLWLRTGSAPAPEAVVARNVVPAPSAAPAPPPPAAAEPTPAPPAVEERTAPPPAVAEPAPAAPAVVERPAPPPPAAAAEPTATPPAVEARTATPPAVPEPAAAPPAAAPAVTAPAAAPPAVAARAPTPAVPEPAAAPPAPAPAVTVPAAAPPAVSPPATSVAAVAAAAAEPLPPAARSVALADTSTPKGGAEVPAEATRPKIERNVPPRIVGYAPRTRGPLNALEGSTLAFNVHVADADTDSDLRYVWSVNGRHVGSGPQWHFTVPPASTATSHSVQVQVADAAGRKSTPVTWTVAVSPKLSERDVRDWLDRLAGAWDRKDVPTLQLYNIVTDDAQASEVRRRLAHHERYAVEIVNARIGTKGSRANVAFDRVEFDGSERLGSVHESYVVEKEPSGLVAVRR
jgi:hypothetical protein